ncbi:MAG: LPP20 family lipoprotein [Bacteroidales bacterium]|nr:LPP20 family lipoprotein [Bacteroidales bacterium]
MRHFIVILSVLLLSACSSQRDLARLRENRPAWAKSKPVSEAYYIGIGSASKSMDVNRYKQIARQKALSNLAEEISVNISSSSVLQQTEINDQLSEQYNSNITTSSEEELKGYEQVDSYEDELQFFVYYRLSKSLYKKIKKERIEKAIAQAKSEWKTSLAYKNEGKYRYALGASVKALDELKAHLNEPLKTNLNGREVYLANEMLSRIQVMLDNIVIIPDKTNVQVVRGSEIRSDKLSFHVKGKNGMPLKGVPVKAEFTAQTLVFDKASSNNEGRLQFRIEKVDTKSNNGIFKIFINMEDILRSSTSDLTIRKLVRQLNVPSAKMNISIEEPVFYVESSEENINQPLQEGVLKNSLLDHLRSRGFKTTGAKQSADFIVTINAHTTKGGEMSNRYSALLDFTLSVRDKEGNPVYSGNSRGIEGMNLDYKKAGLDAYEKAIRELKMNTFEEMMYSVF